MGNIILLDTGCKYFEHFGWWTDPECWRLHFKVSFTKQ